MTPQEFEPLAVWMGWGKEKDDCPRWYTNTGYKGWCSEKTSLTDAECMEALNRLVEKGHHPLIAHAKDGWSIILNCHRQKRERKAGAIYGQPTINKAIEAAILALLKAEGGKE